MQIDASGRNLKIAYLGPSASFSHQAAVEAFPSDSTTSTTLHALPSFHSLFSTIQDASDGKADSFDYAVIPVENSTNGGVVQVLDLLIQCGLHPSSCLFPDVEVVAEHYLSVHHCLYIHPSALSPSISQPASSKSDVPIKNLNITTIYSHPQVWGQCDRFLSAHFSPSTTERIDVSSTSAAALFVAQNPPSPSPSPSNPPSIPAAICSSLAGQQNNLHLLRANIEDEPGKNTTRFLIVRNSRRQTPLPAHLTTPSQPGSGPIFHKSLLTFTIPHNVPGSLASALEVFRKHGLNLTAINSRPSRERNWHYVFFVECQMEAPVGRETEPVMRPELMEDLRRVAERTCWLGSWVDRSGGG